MGELIPFPKPKIRLTEEETLEYLDIKKEINEIETMRQLYYCKKRIKEFMKRVEKRVESEQNKK
jgi:hypothetical protein